ncbi:hypothetical protein LXL04_001009 [Taraxacum kok-saghyz]
MVVEEVKSNTFLWVKNRGILEHIYMVVVISVPASMLLEMDLVKSGVYSNFADMTVWRPPFGVVLVPVLCFSRPWTILPMSPSHALDLLIGVSLGAANVPLFLASPFGAASAVWCPPFGAARPMLVLHVFCYPHSVEAGASH